MSKIKTIQTLPKNPSDSQLYHLPPIIPAGGIQQLNKSYAERTNRNDGCLSKEVEQKILSQSSIAIIGLGGMGGYQAETYVRLGIGTLYIADIGVYDESNINRQWAATKKTVGKEKAFATARMMRDLADDYHLYISPQGLNEQTADFLIKGRDVVIDMIEFWALADRIFLHRTCAKHGVVAINCNSIVHASFGMRFDYRKKPSKKMLGGYQTLIEKYLQMTYERARYLQTRYDEKTISPDEKKELMEAVYRVFIPEEIEYIRDAKYSTKTAFRKRLFEEDKAPVISVNPLFAAGLCATEAYFEIIEQRSPIKRNIVRIATFPNVTRVDIGKKTITSLKLKA